VPESTKSLPELVEELWALLVAYAKQETVGPLQGLAKYVLYGLLGSVMLGIGLIMMVLGGLRALQVEVHSSYFHGRWSWTPYALAIFVTSAMIGLAVSQVRRGSGARSRSGRVSG
jgi:hypothetical protein